MTAQELRALRSRDQPMHDAERVTEVDWHGTHITEGRTIAYNVRVWEPRTTTSRDVRHEGVVVELWLDHWWGSPNPTPYAEVDDTNGTEERVWFHRDQVSTELGFAVGAVVEGALF